MRQFIAFIKKEFYHIFRDRRTMLILLGMPVVQIILFGFAISTEVKNVRLAVLDPSNDVVTRKIIDRLDASEYFTVTARFHSPQEMEAAFLKNEVDMAIVFSERFADDLYTGDARVQLIVDATDPNMSTSQVNYATGIVSMVGQEMIPPNMSAARLTPDIKLLYNPQMKSAYNFVPGVMGLILMLICAMMTSISIVREKETGTMEVLLVSPVKPLFIILAKAVPYFVLSFVNLITILLLSVFVLDVPVVGSLFWLITVSLLFIFVSLALGLLISSVTRTQVAAMLVSGLMLMMPTMLLSGMIFPIESMPVILQWIWAVNLEIKNIQLNIVDNDHSAISQRLVNKIAASTYFRLVEVPASYEEGLRNIEIGTADIVMEIPRHLERDWMNGEDTHILIAANAVNGTKGGLGSSYLSSIINDYAAELRSEYPATATVSGAFPSIGIDTQGLFNPNLNYKLYMIPALMVMLLTLICGFLPALNIVSEKEVGTIEQINVTPVPKFIFILAKLLPYWLIGFVVLTVCFILAWLIYGIVPVGHFLLIYFFAVLFVLVMSGFGLVISNYSATMQQSMFVMWFCLLVVILMSGLFTPISSMPEWAQLITRLNPLRYFMEVMRMVYLKGSGFFDLLPQFGVLLFFAVVFNSWAVISYRKNN